MSENVCLIDLERVLEAATARWMEENCTPEKVMEWVQQRLSQARDNVLLKLLGFDNRWDSTRWELDHCNGRSGNSAAGDRLRALVGEGVKAWLNENSLKLPKLPAEAVKGMQEEYKREFEKALATEVIRRAQNDAQEAANQLGLALTGIKGFPIATKNQ